MLTSKHAKAFISTAQPLSLNFNGLAALATSPDGNDLVRANFPFHSRPHWIDVKTGRLRELEPITVANFQGLDAAFLRLVVNSGSGVSVSQLRACVYDDNEALSRDYEIPCDCLTARPLLDIDGGYAAPPTNLGAHTVPVWYTEIESTPQSSNPPLGGTAPAHNSFTGYWGLEVAGSAATLFHRVSPASLDNLSFGTANAFGNR